MPFNELQRRDSWPPTILRIHDDDADETSPIDEDPFSYFLTSPDDIDDEEDLSAGIESSSKPAPVREVSPSSLQRSPLPAAASTEDEDEDSDLEIPLSLRDFARRYTTSGSETRPSLSDDRPKGLGITIPPLRSSRGRPTLRLVPNGRGRGQTRSLSARRPHSWRVPSPELGSILEERETDEDRGSEETKKDDGAVDSKTHWKSEEEKLSPTSRKRVHWAV